MTIAEDTTKKLEGFTKHAPIDEDPSGESGVTMTDLDKFEKENPGPYLGVLQTMMDMSGKKLPEIAKMLGVEERWLLEELVVAHELLACFCVLENIDISANYKPWIPLAKGRPAYTDDLDARVMVCSVTHNWAGEQIVIAHPNQLVPGVDQDFDCATHWAPAPQVPKEGEECACIG